jgi:hypothetical protein
MMHNVLRSKFLLKTTLLTLDDQICLFFVLLVCVVERGRNPILSLPKYQGRVEKRRESLRALPRIPSTAQEVGELED